MIKPATTEKTKNKRVLNNTDIILELGSLNPITMVRTMIPITSSIIAALTIVVPIISFSFPSSFKTCTVILTDVAVNTVPTKTALKN